jgi:hypothetical protein
MNEKSGGELGSRAGVTLRCDGQEIRLNPFVQRFIEETVSGLVRALDDVPPEPRTIEIRIRRN